MVWEGGVTGTDMASTVGGTRVEDGGMEGGTMEASVMVVLMVVLMGGYERATGLIELVGVFGLLYFTCM